MGDLENLEDETVKGFAAGDVVRFEDGDFHGSINAGPPPFIYMSVTSPPLNFAPTTTLKEQDPKEQGEQRKGLSPDDPLWQAD